ncbi:MAG: lysophospholipase [Anaerolineales bacterium]
MNHIEGTFRGLRNADIYYQAWLPEGEARAALQIVHGLGSHSGRYGSVVDPLVRLGYAVYGQDHIGHGKSGGARCMINRFEDLTHPITMFTGMIRSWQTGKPVFLFGHSMGGLIATACLLDHQADFKGAILSAPAIAIPEGISPAKILVGRFLSVIAPKSGLLRLDPARLSRDPAVVSAYRNDPLVYHGRTPARLSMELVKAMRRVGGELNKITLPFLTFLGGGEQIVNPDGARRLYENAGSQDKTIKVYEGLYHETFNEPERARVLEDMKRWLEEHI